MGKPNTDVKIILYHASWCGYCIKFMREWNKFVKQTKYEAEAIEDQNISEEERETLTGFPTIRIIIDGIKYNYEGERTVKDLNEAIETKKGLVPANKVEEESEGQKGEGQKGEGQTGGRQDENSDYYKMKYLKYKAKYLKLMGSQ